MTKTRKCLHCRQRHPMEGMIKLPAGWFCDSKHAYRYSVTKRVGKAKKMAVSARKAHRMSDRAHQLSLTQTAFNKLRRLEEYLWFANREQEPTCISCGGLIGGDQWATGHFKSVGASSALRFDKKNTFLQHNRRCNMALSGDIAGTTSTMGYKKGLIHRFGEGGQAIIDYLELPHQPKKWTCDELITMRKGYNAEIRAIKHG